MAHPSTYHHPLAFQQRPTSWLAASHLPITPPATCTDYATTFGPAAKGLYVNASVAAGPPPPHSRLGYDSSVDVISTPALSFSSSASSSTSSLGEPSSSLTSAHWQLSSPDGLAGHAAGAAISPAACLAARSAVVPSRRGSGDGSDLMHLVQARRLERKCRQDKSASSLDGGSSSDEGSTVAHPRIVKAPSDRKPGFVEGLVDTAEIAITSIWTTSAESGSAASDGSVLPLRWFIKETLRRSRTSCSTLQLALFYLHRGRMRIRERVVRAESAKAHLARLAASSAYPSPPASPPLDGQFGGDEDSRFTAELVASSRDPIVCGRRMFLAALISASKFLQDRNYSSRAWSKISGLTVHEINSIERALLNLLEYQLFVPAESFANWTSRLERLASEHHGHHRSDLGDEPMSPLSPISPHLTSSRLPAGLPRSSSEYLPAPSKGSEMHATLPTPMLSDISTCPPTAGLGLRRSESDRFLGPEGLVGPIGRRASMSFQARSCKQEDRIQGWLASSASQQQGVH